MFERFTAAARRAIVLAQEEARCIPHNHIGTEHLLLGLMVEENIAARALKDSGLTLDDGRLWARERIGVAPAVQAGHIPFTPRAKKALELSLRCALELGHNYLGTEHLLLGLIREGGDRQGDDASTSMRMMHELDVIPYEVMTRTIDLINGVSPVVSEASVEVDGDMVDEEPPVLMELEQSELFRLLDTLTEQSVVLEMVRGEIDQSLSKLRALERMLLAKLNS